MGTGAPQGYVRALTQLVADTWSDEFFSAMTLSPGEAEFTIDGETTEIEAAPAVAGNEILLPFEAVAQLRGLPPELAPQGEPALVTQSEAEALGLHVENDEKEIIVTAPYQTRRLLVKTTGGKLSNAYGAVVTLPLSEGRYALQYATEEAARLACLRLEADPAIAYAEPDGIVSLGAGVEVSVVSETAVQATSWGTNRIGAPAFQALLPANPPSITVAVLDSGIDAAHPVFAGRLSDTRWNFVGGNGNPDDDHGHGTLVSGIVVDATSPNVRIMPLKVLDGEGKGVHSLAIEALRYAADRGARVANMSLGGPAMASGSWSDALNYIHGKGMTAAAAAGNEGVATRNYPAALPGVIAVSASTSFDTLARFSNRGGWVDLGAPGDGIVSAYPGGRYATASGTSMATPYVSAAAALILSYCAMPHNDILPYLRSLCDSWASPEDAVGGAGILNLTPRGASPTMQLSITAGESALLRVSQCPPILGQALTYASANPNVVAIGPGGGFVGIQPGTANLTVSGAGGLLATATVTVTGTDRIGAAFSGMALLSQPAKREYGTGEPLNTAGGRLRLSLSDGGAMDVDLRPEYCAGYDPYRLGTQTVTVSLSGKTASFTVAVKERAKSIEIVRLPNKLTYREGEAIDLTGGTVRATNANGGTEVIPMTSARIHFDRLGERPGPTGFELVQLVCDGAAGADFVIVYVGEDGYLEGLRGSDVLIYKQDYFTLPPPEIPHVRWESTNPSVLTLDAEGTFVFNGIGSTAITLVYDPPAHPSKFTLGRIDVRVRYTLLQWLLVIFLFGWIWL